MLVTSALVSTGALLASVGIFITQSADAQSSSFLGGLGLSNLPGLNLLTGSPDPAGPKDLGQIDLLHNYLQTALWSKVPH